MAEDYHVDLSVCLYRRGTTGIACVGAITKKHVGCALKGRLKKYIYKTLCKGSVREEYAKLYAICIYYLIRNFLDDIKTLVICNDEDFNHVKNHLHFLLSSDGADYSFNIASITDLQNSLGRKIKSLADNLAKCYRKRGLKMNKLDKGRELNVVEITYTKIKNKWKNQNNDHK